MAIYRIFIFGDIYIYMVVQNTAAGSIILFTVVEPKMQLVYVQREILGKNYTFPIQGSYFCR